ncbi:MAG: ATP-dependent helicase [Thermoleophilaceae bacterium]
MSFTIEERVCWLLGQGIAAKSIAAVSFTRASAGDLQERIRAACAGKGHDHSGIAVSTLHSLALRALKARGILGSTYPVDPRVLDRWELRNLFDKEFGEAMDVGTITRRAEIRGDFEAFWSTGKHEPRASQKPPDPPVTDEERDRFRAFHGLRSQLYACVLPGEIVQRCVEMMEAGTLDPAALLGIEHLIVDEYQDLNPMDLRFVRALAGNGVKLFVAGDDDQSLYSFRYALPEGIQRFDQEFPGCGDHALRHCFRCTPAVLNMAETLIAANAADGRIPKEYMSLYEDADPKVSGASGCWRFADARDEARAIAESCRRLIGRRDAATGDHGPTQQRSCPRTRSARGVRGLRRSIRAATREAVQGHAHRAGPSDHPSARGPNGRPRSAADAVGASPRRRYPHRRQDRARSHRA